MWLHVFAIVITVTVTRGVKLPFTWLGGLIYCFSSVARKVPLKHTHTHKYTWYNGKCDTSVFRQRSIGRRKKERERAAF